MTHLITSLTSFYSCCYVWQAVIEAVGKSGLHVNASGKEEVGEPNEDKKELSTVVLSVSLPSEEEEKVGIFHSTPLRLFVYICLPHPNHKCQTQLYRLFGQSAV